MCFRRHVVTPDGVVSSHAKATSNRRANRRSLKATITRQQDVEVRRIDPVSAHEYDRSFDHISEFAHVSRPGMILQTLDRCRSQGLGRIGPSRKPQKMPSQQFDIATPLM